MTGDPIGEEGGLNLFGFIQNQPVLLVDYLGLSCYSPELQSGPNLRLRSSMSCPKQRDAYGHVVDTVYLPGYWYDTSLIGSGFALGENTYLRISANSVLGFKGFFKFWGKRSLSRNVDFEIQCDEKGRISASPVGTHHISSGGYSLSIITETDYTTDKTVAITVRFSAGFNATSTNIALKPGVIGIGFEYEEDVAIGGALGRFTWECVCCK